MPAFPSLVIFATFSPFLVVFSFFFFLYLHFLLFFLVRGFPCVSLVPFFPTRLFLGLFTRPKERNQPPPQFSLRSRHMRASRCVFCFFFLPVAR